MTIAQVRTALANAVDGMTGLRATAYIVDSVATPQAVVSLNAIDYDLVMGRGADIYNYTVRVYTQRSSDRAAQLLLDTLREPTGATSLKTVVEADSSLAALIDYVRVTNASEVQTTTVGAVDYLFVEFTLEVCY